MKFLVAFVALFAVAFGSQGLWTIGELSAALESPHTDPNMIPYLEQALNDLMMTTVLGAAPQQAVTVVSTGAMEFSTWTLAELSEALQNPDIDPVLKPFLEHALNQMMASLFAGEQQEFIVVATPVGVLDIPTVAPAVNPVDVIAIIPTPVNPEIEVAPVVIPEPVVAPAAAGPLVQIIVNVNKPEEIITPGPAVNPVDVIAVNPVVLPSPALPEVFPEPIIMPEPVLPVVVPESVILPEAAQPEVYPEPIIMPEPVLPVVVVPEVNPIDVIAVIDPSPAINPIDVIAVIDPSPAINPVDVIATIPIVDNQPEPVVVCA